MRTFEPMGYGAAALLSFSLILLLPGTSSADKQVTSGEILVISDEILGHSVEIEREGGNAPPSNGAPDAELPDAPTLSDGGGTGGGTDDGGDPLASGGGNGNDQNRSGLGDGSNPGLGSDNNNSGNDGYDNPSQGSDRRGFSGRSGRSGRGFRHR